MSARTVVTLLIVAAFLVIVAAFLPAPQPTAAQTSNTIDLSGWLWSSNIGWISLSGTAASGAPYQVSINSSGNFTGYAWSSNIGWINFAPQQTTPGGSADPAQIPVSPNGSGQLQIADGATATGWIRACAVFVGSCSGALKSSSELGGWDGWIKMSGAAANGAAYGVSKVTFSDGSEGLVGYAWGGDNLGWINFNTKNSGCAVGDANCHPVPPDCGTNPSLPECGTHIDPGAPPSGLTCAVTADQTTQAPTVDPVSGAKTYHISWSVEAHGADGTGDYSCGLPPTPDGEPVGSDPGSVDNGSIDSTGNTGVSSDGGSGDPLISHQSNHLLPLNLLGLPVYAATTACTNVGYCFGDQCLPSRGGNVNYNGQTTPTIDYTVPTGGTLPLQANAKVTITGVPPQFCSLSLNLTNAAATEPDLNTVAGNTWIEILTHAAGLPSVPARNDAGQPAKIKNDAGQSTALHIQSITSIASGQTIEQIANNDPAYEPLCALDKAADSSDNSTPTSWQPCNTGSWISGGLGTGEIAKFSVKFPKRGHRFTDSSPYRVIVADNNVTADPAVTLYYSVGGITEY